LTLRKLFFAKKIIDESILIGKLLLKVIKKFRRLVFPVPSGPFEVESDKLAI
jgi:hypothetical protein